MPTPARGPQTTTVTQPKNNAPFRRGATFIRTPRLAEPSAVIGSIVALCIARRQLSSSCRRRLRATLAHVRYDWTAEPQREAQRRSVLSDSSQPRFAEAVEAEGSPAPSAAAQCSSACAPFTRSSSRCSSGRCSRKQNMGIRGLAWHVPCFVRFPCCAASFDVGCSALGCGN